MINILNNPSESLFHEIEAFEISQNAAAIIKVVETTMATTKMISTELRNRARLAV